MIVLGAAEKETGQHVLSPPELLFSGNCSVVKSLCWLLPEDTWLGGDSSCVTVRVHLVDH